MANLLRAIQNIVNNPISDLLDSYQENNQISDKGILLEELIQDIFANTLAEENKGGKDSGARSYIQRDFHFTKFLNMISCLQQVMRSLSLRLCY